jgi:hypothetical protein
MMQFDDREGRRDRVIRPDTNGHFAFELGIELIASADVDRLDRVIEARFLEKEGDSYGRSAWASNRGLSSCYP